MPAAKMTVALLEAHRGFQQDPDREEANSAFFGLIDRGTKGGAVCLGRNTVYIKRRPRKDSRFLPLLPGSGHICALCLMISGQRRLNWPEQVDALIELSVRLCVGKLPYNVRTLSELLRRCKCVVSQ